MPSRDSSRIIVVTLAHDSVIVLSQTLTCPLQCQFCTGPKFCSSSVFDAYLQFVRDILLSCVYTYSLLTPELCMEFAIPCLPYSVFSVL